MSGEVAGRTVHPGGGLSAVEVAPALSVDVDLRRVPRLEVLEVRAREARAGADRAAAALATAALDPDGAPRERLDDARERWQLAQDRLEASVDRLEAAVLLERSRRDGLTGALQRDAGQPRLQQELDRSHRGGTVLVLAFLDVDGLKAINDTRGHAAGDDALRAVGRALLGCLRSYDVVVRYGGDEFVCALPGLDLTQAASRFEEVTHLLDALCPGTTVSVGLSLAEAHDTVSAVLARADRELYALRSSRAPAARSVSRRFRSVDRE
ncbi:MAG: diguanylate cyclase response regulator [Frankiales bacterium]|nr:diguanylate cyclase response regulator [Frankiales bacterium]